MKNKKDSVMTYFFKKIDNPFTKGYIYMLVSSFGDY